MQQIESMTRKTVKMIRNVAIVSLSSGTIGEDYVSHEIKIGLKRLKDYGLDVRFMPNALSGVEYLEKHPEDRAADLLEAFQDPDIDMILCAIGGDDTYRLLPYLFENDELKKAVSEKIFLGFSDTTINHLMLHKVGLNTFYGQSFLADICELDREMLPYTRTYFEELIDTGTIRKIIPSDIWYEGRNDFSIKQIGTPLISHKNSGFELLQGEPVFSGKILGGCIDSLYDMFDPETHENMPELCRKYQLFPDIEGWKGKILLLESSEQKMSPEKYRRALMYLRDTGIFEVISGILVGKPMDEVYSEEYKKALKEETGNKDLPILCNLNIGHALPRCIIPFGIDAVVNAIKQTIVFNNEEESL